MVACGCKGPSSFERTERLSLNWPYSLALQRCKGPSSFERDRKSTRLNSSHDQISYAVFCLKKKKNQQDPMPTDRQTSAGVERRHTARVIARRPGKRMPRLPYEAKPQQRDTVAEPTARATQQ